MALPHFRTFHRPCNIQNEHLLIVLWNRPHLDLFHPHPLGSRIHHLGLNLIYNDYLIVSEPDLHLKLHPVFVEIHKSDFFSFFLDDSVMEMKSRKPEKNKTFMNPAGHFL